MLRGDEKVCKLKEKTWAKVYVVIHSIIIILIIAQLATPKWVEIGSSRSIKGGILECNEGCGGKKTYAEIYDDVCGSSSYYDDYDYEDESNEYSTSICDSFNDLAKAGQSKIALDIISIFFIVLWSLTMFIFPKFKCIRCFNFFFSLLSLVFYVAGTASWMSRTLVDFGDCYFNVCASDGPKLSLAILFILFASLKFYLCLIRVLFYQRRMKQLKKDHGVFGEARVFVGTAQPHNNIMIPPNIPNSQAMPQPIVYSQPMPQPIVYSQPMPQPIVYSQAPPIYNQPIYPQVVTPGFSYPVNGSYNPNVNDGKNKNLEENDLTVLDNTKNNN